MTSKIIIGASGWVYPEWRNIFYPKELPQAKWLEYYQAEFDVVEVNATFYRFFADEVYLKWKESAKNNFKYIMKVPRLITHKKYLENSAEDIKQFCSSVSLLQNNLALILLQLAPKMPYNLKILEQALLAFNNPNQVVVEFRDKRWLTQETKNLLTQLGCIFCIIDSPSMELLPWVTSSIAYIRLHGRIHWYDYNYSLFELKKIAALVNHMLKNNVQTVYILFNNTCHGFAVQNAKTLANLFAASRSDIQQLL